MPCRPAGMRRRRNRLPANDLELAQPLQPALPVSLMMLQRGNMSWAPGGEKVRSEARNRYGMICT
jgi:hypothetical protein